MRNLSDENSLTVATSTSSDGTPCLVTYIYPCWFSTNNAATLRSPLLVFLPSSQDLKVDLLGYVNATPALVFFCLNKTRSIGSLVSFMNSCENFGSVVRLLVRSRHLLGVYNLDSKILRCLLHLEAWTTSVWW